MLTVAPRKTVAELPTSGRLAVVGLTGQTVPGLRPPRNAVVVVGLAQLKARLFPDALVLVTRICPWVTPVELPSETPPVTERVPAMSMLTVPATELPFTVPRLMFFWTSTV